MPSQPAGHCDRVDVLCVETTAAGGQGLPIGDERMLSPAECDRAARFVSLDARRQFVTGRCLARSVFGERLGIAPADVVIEIGPRGKPQLATVHDAPKLRFNLSHCSGCVVLAVRTVTDPSVNAITLPDAAVGDIGIDVEAIDRNVDLAVARHVFSNREQATLHHAAPQHQAESLLRLWTAKEAWVKATGIGISDCLQQFSVTVPDATSHNDSVGGDDDGLPGRFSTVEPVGIEFAATMREPCDRWQIVQTVFLNRYIIAVAASATPQPPSLHWHDLSRT